MRRFWIAPIAIALFCLTGCGGAGSTTDVTSSTNDVVAEIEQQVNIQHTGQAPTDQVTFTSTDSTGNQTPITLMGTRFDGENWGPAVAQNICKMLGFSNIAASAGTVTPAAPEIDAAIKTTSGSLSGGTTPFALQVAFPAFHMDVAVNALSAYFNLVPSIGTYYFTTPTMTQYDKQHPILNQAPNEYATATQKNYLSFLSCMGTTPAHWDANGNFNATNFLQNLLQNKMGVTMNPNQNHYSSNIPFMVRAANGSYGVDVDNNQNLFVNKDGSILASAQAGAQDICTQSGLPNLIFFNFKYLLSSQVTTQNVYQWANGVWQEVQATAKYIMAVSEDVNYSSSPATKNIEVPGIYLDQVICSN